MKPTATATLRLSSSTHINHTPPTRAKGRNNITISDSVTRWKFRYRNKKTSISVTGATLTG